MSTQGRNGADQSGGKDFSQSESSRVASGFRETAGNVCRLGGAMIRDLGRGMIGHKEVVSLARAAGVVLGGARVGAAVGFNRDLAGDSAPASAAADADLAEEAELTARLESLRERRSARAGG